MGRRAPKFTLAEMEALRDAASRESLERIESDLARASWKIRPMLEQIRERLFDPELDLGELLTPRGAGSGRTVDFHREMGETLGDYVDKERVATTARLLGRVRFSLDDLAYLVGFSDRSVLSNTFQRHTGLRPSDFRKKWEQTVQTAGKPKIEMHSLQLLKDLREGRLSASQARKLLDFFDRLDQDRRPEPRKPSASARELAEDAWRRISQRDQEEQLLWVRDVLRFNRSAFFMLLGDKIQEEIASDSSGGPAGKAHPGVLAGPQNACAPCGLKLRAVQDPWMGPAGGPPRERSARAPWWTLLAMVHVEANSEEIGEEETRALRPLALKWLADVRRHAGPMQESGLNQRSLLRLQRLEARLLHGVGQMAEAEKLFRQTRLEFLRQYCTADAALASLGLALLLFERGENSEIPGLASQAIPVLQAHPERGDARSALRDLGEAIRGDSLTPEVLVATRVCLARLCPSLLEFGDDAP